jgi:hypothetical protein
VGSLPFSQTPFRLPLSATDEYLGLRELPLVPVVAIGCQHSVRYEPNELPGCGSTFGKHRMFSEFLERNLNPINVSAPA